VICRYCFYHIHDLWRIHQYISHSVTTTIATPLFTSRLDYCNSLFYNITFKDIAKLQYSQKCLARVVTGSPWFSHAVPSMKSLHSLPVQSHIIFKLCPIAYETLSSGESLYLFYMLSPSPECSIHLVFTCCLFPELKLMLALFFSIAVPTPWNSLPEHVTSSNSIVSFCQHLKTHLFRLAYLSQVFRASNHLLMNFALYLAYEFDQPLY